MSKQFRKIVSLLLALIFLTTSVNLSLASEKINSSDTLAVYYKSQLISEGLDKIGFSDSWIRDYVNTIALKMVERFNELKKVNANISMADVKKELALEVKELVRLGKIPEDRSSEVINSIDEEFEKLINPPRPETKKKDMPARNEKYEKIEWLTPKEATDMLNALPTINSEKSLKEFYKEAEKKGISAEEFVKRLRPELAQMADILAKTRPVDELNALTEKNGLVFEGEDVNDPAVKDRQVMRLDILRALSEFVLQLLPDSKTTDNIARLKEIREVFVKYPEVSRLLVKYFEARFMPGKRLDDRGEAAGDIRVKILEILRDINTTDPEGYSILDKSIGIAIATVKTDYFVKGRTSLFFAIDPRSIVKYDERGALIHTPPYSIIWIHVPYGAYGAHSRYANVARGGIRMINPARKDARNKILPECVRLALTQHRKHMDIPEGGAKGVFINEEGLNAVAAMIGYAGALIRYVKPDENIAPASDASPTDPRITATHGPDEGTGLLSSLATVYAWMENLEGWRIFMTGKTGILGGVSHMDNNLLTPHVEEGNRVTSQGVIQHALLLRKYLILKGRMKPENDKVFLSVTGGLDGDVASGIVERFIHYYYGEKSENCAIRGMVDASGVMFDPAGLDHGALLKMYKEENKEEAQTKNFPKDKLHKGGFVAPVKYGAGEDSYVELGADTLEYMNTRALDPEVIKGLGIEKQYKAQAKLGEGDSLVTVLERDVNNHPSKVKVHSVYLRDIFFFLVKADMLLTGGGVSNSMNQKNWPLFFDWDGKPTAVGITHGANVFMHKEASINLEKKGVIIEPDEKANSVGVEISSRMEVDFNLIFKNEEITPALVRGYFEQVLDKCLKNARVKFWALRMEAEDHPDESVVVNVSSAMSAEVIRLSDLIAASDLVGYKKSDYSEAVLNLLRGYFPDVSDIDKAYEKGTIGRVFERMPPERIKMIASKMIAKEVVLNLGTNGVKEIARKTGVKDIDVIEKYLTASDKLKTSKEVADVVDGYAVPVEKKIPGLRALRQELKNTMEESLAATDTVIGNVKELTGIIATHNILKPERAADLSSIAIIVKKGLAESVTGEERMQGARGETLKAQYKIVEQNLRKIFTGDGMVAEVSDENELKARRDEFLAKGKKVVILDDGTLTKDLDPDAKGNYCVITTSGVEDGDTNIVPFVNLNAMAMMGVGILYNDLPLFETAYETFTGKDITNDLIARLVRKLLWIVRASPRCVKITNELPDQEKFKKLVDAAA